MSPFCPLRLRANLRKHRQGDPTVPRRSIIALLLLISAASCKVISADPEAGRNARGPTGAVTAGHPLAAEAGLEVLRNGGNAMDAAITMAAVLSVARPHMNGVGGDMFLIYYD